ncbi:hypothetical protein FQN49_008416, partial [Arthroderma sp. PD_2]
MALVSSTTPANPSLFHHTMFAPFWAAEIENNSERIQGIKNIQMRYENQLSAIRSATSARRIMINDTWEFNKSGDPEAPQRFMIWYPLQPAHQTLSDLADKVPSMKEQVAIASIITDFRGLYKCHNLWLAARKSPNQLYLDYLTRKTIEQGQAKERSGWHMSGAVKDCI